MPVVTPSLTSLANSTLNRDFTGLDRRERLADLANVNSQRRYRDLQAKAIPLDQQYRQSQLDLNERKLAHEESKMSQESFKMAQTYAAQAATLASQAPPEQRSERFAQAIEQYTNALPDRESKEYLKGFLRFADDPKALQQLPKMASMGQSRDQRYLAPVKRLNDQGQTELVQPGNMAGMQERVLGIAPPSGSKNLREVPAKDPQARAQNRVDVVDDQGRVVHAGVQPEAYREETDKQMAKQAAKQMQTISEKSASLREQQYNLKKAMDIIATAPVEHGVFANQMVLAKELAQYVPGLASMVSSESVGPSQVVDALFKQIQASRAGSMSKASDYEQKLLRDAYPHLTQSTEGRDVLMEHIYFMNQHELDLNKHLQRQAFQAQREGRYFNIDVERDQWLEQNPLENFVPDNLKEKTKRLAPLVWSEEAGDFVEDDALGPATQQQAPGASGSKKTYTTQDGQQVTEDQVELAMKKYNLTRDQVIQSLGLR